MMTTQLMRVTLLFLIFMQIVATIKNLDKKPNIVIFLVDDFGWGDFGANMKDRNVTSNSPFMDKFSKTGMRFTDFHTASSVCSPSRAALLTGRLGLRNGVNMLFGPYSVGGLPLTEITLTEVLKHHGYQTFAIGKWHLGHHGPYHPTERGFDHYFGVPYSLDSGCLDWPGFIHPSRKACFQKQSWIGLPLYKDKDILQQPLKLKDLSNLYVKEFKQRIDEAGKTKKPFFAYVPFSHLHVPLGFDQSFWETSKTVFGDALRELDSSIEKMINHLKKKQMLENTWIWLLGDNGPWESQCQYGGSPGPFQGHWQKKQGGGGTSWKLTVWEGGHRVPGFVSWQNRIKPNTISDHAVSAMDILPTIAKEVGCNLPTDRHYDGQDVGNLLFDKRIISGGNKVLYHPRSDGKSGNITAIRYKNFKAIFETGGPAPLLDCQMKSGPHFYHNPPLLFDLDSDEGEEKPINVKEQVKYQNVMNKILSLRKTLMQDIANDKRSIVDTRQSTKVKPCCNSANPVCRC